MPVSQYTPHSSAALDADNDDEVILISDISRSHTNAYPNPMSGNTRCSSSIGELLGGSYLEEALLSSSRNVIYSVLGSMAFVLILSHRLLPEKARAFDLIFSKVSHVIVVCSFFIIPLTPPPTPYSCLPSYPRHT